ncbi:hypothetical protein [Ornithinibacillus sp. FSL M8-0202]|uniref:hypothetical protein n=1 Tax=unclassified Ornithinibacillus TaxID=2620869 RepID=UPI0030D0F4C0
MKDNQSIQEDLHNLPTHSLNKEQKQRILLHLKAGVRPVTRKVIRLPILAMIISIAFFMILVIYEFNDNNSLPQTAHSPLELHAMEGKTFIMPGSGQELIGIEDNVALLNVFDHFVAEDTRRVAKLMIFYWGNPSELIEKNYRVEAINSYGQQLTLSEGSLNSPLYQEDAHTLTSFSPFPTEGTWQLSFLVEDEIHGAFTLEVLPAFPKTEHYTLIDSPLEIEIGQKTEISIESSWKDKEEIEVTLLDENGIEVDSDNFLQNATNIDSATNNPIYLYSGSLSFPEKGTWVLVIDGEKTEVFDN